MTVNSFLVQKASGAVLSAAEKASITTSISTLQSRIGYHFGSSVKEHFKFGSYTRDTILPRSMDDQSDIDYMVVFESGYTPQTYLTKLKTFVEKYYSSSEIFQSSPTIVLNLNHIRFELVPAIAGMWGGYQIPDGSGSWQDTNPNDFNTALSDRNQACSYLLKPAIRLVKYWNAQRGYVFSSYPLEKWMAAEWYVLCYDLKDHLFYAIDNASLSWTEAQWRKDELSRAQGIVETVKSYIANGYEASAEAEMKKLIPA